MSNKKFTLSLVIPVFNEDGYLDVCLKAIAKQTVQPDEVIVVDNNSSDNSADIARRYRFVKLIREKSQGVLHARNTGFDYAKSDIIGRIDADTVLPPRWVEHVINSFTDERTTAVTGPVNYYDMPFGESNHHPDHFMRRSIYNWSPKSPFLFGSNMAIRNKTWKSIKSRLCNDYHIHEDLDLAIHLYKNDFKILYTKNLLCGVSGRRYNDNVKRFYVYMSMYRQSYIRHNLHSLAIYSATGVYWMGYLIFHPIRNLWYDFYSSSKPKMIFTRISRKNPMH